MANSDPRVDANIASAVAFASLTLEDLRAQLHAACPGLEETLKWQAPAFTYRGKLLAVMAVFKAHVALNLWHGAQMGAELEAAEGMGQFGRIAAPADLPPRPGLAGFLRKSMALIAEGAPRGGPKSPRPSTTPEPPEDFRAVLVAQGAARRVFEGFPGQAAGLRGPDP